ncbi:MAG: hypothetical protein J6T10_02145, partial [Methanobrevibacter sp.]|nr:hypothetical protein [Methanobrevibacter sp.]
MGNVDGTVIIEARITDDKFKGDVDKLTKELYKYEREAEKLANQKARLDINTQQAENSLEKINGQISLLDNKIKNMQENNLPQNLVGNFDYEKLLIQRDELVRKSDLEVAKLSELDDKQAQLNTKTAENLRIRQMISNEISKASGGMKLFNNDTAGASKTVNHTLKSMTRWGLAIFGIRSAYMGIRQIMNGVFAQNTKLGDQMDAMKKSIAGAFTPIVEKILNLIRTLMAYINYLWKGLFGKNLFSEKVEKNLKSGAKSAKEIRNQLAGFDEANVLSSNSSSGGGAGGGGATDLKLSDVPIPGWLKWIRDFIEKHPTISKIIFGLAAFTLFGGWKIAGGIFDVISALIGGGTGAGATGLLGVLGILSILTASIWTIKIVYDDAKKFGEEIDNDIEKGKKGLKDWASQEEDIDLLLMNQHNHRLAGYEALKDSSNFLTKIYGLDDERLKQAKSTAEVLKSEVDQEVNLYKQGKTNKRQQDEIKQAILDQVAYNNKLIQKLDWVGEDSTKIRKINEDLIQDYKDMGGNVEDVKDNLIGINTVKLDDKKINVAVAVDTSNAQSKLDLLISKTSNAFSKIGAALGGTNTRIKYNA